MGDWCDEKYCQEEIKRVSALRGLIVMPPVDVCKRFTNNQFVIQPYQRRLNKLQDIDEVVYVLDQLTKATGDDVKKLSDQMLQFRRTSSVYFGWRMINWGHS